MSALQQMASGSAGLWQTKPGAGELETVAAMRFPYPIRVELWATEKKSDRVGREMTANCMLVIRTEGIRFMDWEEFAKKYRPIDQMAKLTAGAIAYEQQERRPVAALLDMAEADRYLKPPPPLAGDVIEVPYVDVGNGAPAEEDDDGR